MSFNNPNWMRGSVDSVSMRDSVTSSVGAYGGGMRPSTDYSASLAVVVDALYIRIAELDKANSRIEK